MKFLTDKDVLPEKELLEKATVWKRFEYSPLGKDLKAQTSVAEKQYQEFILTYTFLETNIIGKIGLSIG